LLAAIWAARVDSRAHLRDGLAVRFVPCNCGCCINGTNDDHTYLFRRYERKAQEKEPMTQDEINDRELIYDNEYSEADLNVTSAEGRSLSLTDFRKFC
jgi:hypothetical protein